jgi:hypothetical protein
LRTINLDRLVHEGIFVEMTFEMRCEQERAVMPRGNALVPFMKQKEASLIGAGQSRGRGREVEFGREARLLYMLLYKAG